MTMSRNALLIALALACAAAPVQAAPKIQTFEKVVVVASASSSVGCGVVQTYGAIRGRLQTGEMRDFYLGCASQPDWLPRVGETCTILARREDPRGLAPNPAWVVYGVDCGPGGFRYH